MSQPVLLAVEEGRLLDARFDAVVLVTARPTTGNELLDRALARARSLDASVDRDVSLIAADVSGGRLIVAPTGPVQRDFDDVRRFADAGRAGALRARSAGSQAPLFVVVGSDRFAHCEHVALLGALAALWEPLEAREALGEQAVEPVHTLGLASRNAQQIVNLVSALEQGRRLARDLTGTEPERMRPEAFAAMCVDALAEGPVQLRVIEELDTLSYQYPLLMAVARASLAVERHRPRVVHLEYVGEGPIERTILLAGKGLTYDMGGADLKTGGHMAGMSRDKGGAAAVAGLFKVLSILRPRGVRVLGLLGLLRNAIGPDSYVSDEIVRSHAGVRVRIGNTDAEGRLVLADLLSHLRVTALEAESPHILSLATLTSHAHRAMGNYSILIENGPARESGATTELEQLGECWGDPFERSRLRRDDYEFIRPRSTADDVLSANTLPSSGTPRGHQYPTAFLTVASGLTAHGGDAAQPLPFTHIDLGGSAIENGDWQHGRPTASPVVPLSLWALAVK